ncbi:DNA polymerase III, subunits gamma and tau [Caldicellulosiruptor obsidiansis OB47]|uniref:DNA-directed DNA polymerase n=1 Tax=Caldicellulosiruptor obsidiansis (strain ATCC BAA-2073 / JCM 16842 / OB47) TaxID=608506 RepID=D9TG33_CALOO|nr:DNA polymerase III subunit gamma/tau [Caldicellulosiruptor obsidiansis]ADL43153.1 DNA polymerase III, subunits gamma and tau [Caldicellulosiruptor obsidiansis OB47]
MHIALYRKYRPKVFEDVVAQDHITKTLKNQIKQDKVAHAYIFCGPRGTGKTTTAKIMSRAVNCLNPKDGNPCNECEVCRSILDEKTLDVLEIDAASNTSVNDVRQIRDEVRYPPSMCKKKVYIIDEVHMLSTGAFNALLKTIEEPPSHALFILATTDIQKVPATILSRCQRFDFKRISVKDIYERLKKIVQMENISIDDNALYLISQKAEGALRDALTILERCINTSDEHITYKFVANLLGVTSTEIVKDFIAAVVENDSNKGLKVVNRLWDEGMDVNTFLEEAVKLLRSALILRLGAKEVLIDMLEDDKAFVINISNLVDSNRLVSSIKMLIDTANQIRWTRFPKVLLEINTIKLCDSQFDTSFETLLERVRKLETKLSQLAENPKAFDAMKLDKAQSTKQEQKTPHIADKSAEGVDTNASFSWSEILSRWEEIKEAVKEEKPGLSHVLQSASLKFENGVKVCFKQEDSVFAEVLSRNLDYFKSVLKRIIEYDGEIFIEVENQKPVQENAVSEKEIINKLKDMFPDTEITVKE